MSVSEQSQVESPPRNESSGFLSSLISAAHNIANNVKHDDESAQDKSDLINSKRSSSHHNRERSRNFLHLPGKGKSLRSSILDSSTGILENDNATEGTPSNDASNGSTSELRSNSPDIATSNVHFEPIHNLPINTLGTGDLLLLHFDKGDNSPIHVPQVSVEMASDHQANSGVPVQALGNADGTISHRGSVSRQNMRESTDDGAEGSDFEDDSVAESDSSAQDLEQIIDSSKISFAPSKKNKEFHSIFKKIPSSDRLISEFSCALSKDILVQGKMYLSQHYICFSSNILGWVTHIVIPLSEVIQIEKKSTAVLFPNGMIIRTLHQKYTFATFIARDHTFNEITKVWHGVLDSSDRLPKRRSRSRSKRSANDFTEDETDDGESGSSVTSISGSEGSAGDEGSEMSETKTEDSSGDKGDAEVTNLDAEYESEKANSPASGDAGDSGGLPNPGPSSHAPTKIPDDVEDRSDVFILDETFKAPLGAVFNILFGSDTSHFVKILESQKNFDIEKDKIVGLSDSNKERNYTYTKPLNGPIGPKQTKCIITEKVVHLDYSLYIHLEQMTQTPDVPSGNLFQIKTKLFFSWASGNGTKLHVTTTVEWSGKSWIKGAIEKGSIDGQKESMKNLTELLVDIIDASQGGSPKKSKRRKSRRKSQLENQSNAPPPQKDLSIGEQLTNLASSVGKSVPVSIPYLGDAFLGGILIFTGVFIIAWIMSFIFGRSGSSNRQGTLHDASDRLVRFSNNEFFVLPDQDNYLSNTREKMFKEAGMWSWIFARSKGEIPDFYRESREFGDYNTHANQDFEEIVRLTKKRLDDIYDMMQS